jgi:hypothetical protein
MTNYLRAAFPILFVDTDDAATREADLHRNDFSPQFASRNSVDSNCYVDPGSGLIYVRSPLEQTWLSMFGAHEVQLPDGSTTSSDTMRVIFPQELVDHLRADPAFDAAYHQLTSTKHEQGENPPPPGGQADYNPQTHTLLGTGSMDIISPVGGVGNIIGHREADVGPYDAFHTSYPDPDHPPGPDLSAIKHGDWQSNFGPCEDGDYKGDHSANAHRPAPVEIPVHDYIQHAFDHPQAAAAPMPDDWTTPHLDAAAWSNDHRDEAPTWGQHQPALQYGLEGFAPAHIGSAHVGWMDGSGDWSSGHHPDNAFVGGGHYAGGSHDTSGNHDSGSSHDSSSSHDAGSGSSGHSSGGLD